MFPPCRGYLFLFPFPEAYVIIGYAENEDKTAFTLFLRALFPWLDCLGMFYE